MRYLLLMMLATALAAAGCSKGSSVDPDGGTDTDSDFLVPLSGVEILVVLHNSGGMSEESAILADALFYLVNTLMTPLDGSSHAAVDNIRVAITTTDIGLSWGGNPYEEGDGWPGTNPCSASGDHGVFQTYAEGTTWGDDIPCPVIADSWAETSSENLNQSLADQAACLANQGTAGCGWEQQLQAAATAMDRTDQADFFHDDSLLLVLVVSNDDECSLEDGPGMFATDEIQDLSKSNLACGMNPEYLYSIEHYADLYRARKNNAGNAIAFASIVGVPVNDTCQGAGNEIGDCLDHPDMHFTEVIVQNSAGTDVYAWDPSCERGTVTTAWPGRRFVELAQAFGDFGYVSSICNEDWTPAMNDIAEMIFTTIEESP